MPLFAADAPPGAEAAPATTGAACHSLRAPPSLPEDDDEASGSGGIVGAGVEEGDDPFCRPDESDWCSREARESGTGGVVLGWDMANRVAEAAVKNGFDAAPGMSTQQLPPCHSTPEAACWTRIVKPTQQRQSDVLQRGGT